MNNINRNISTIIVLVLYLCALPLLSNAKILPGLVDRAGNPVHTADEFNLIVTTTVTLDPQGYRYSYTLISDLASMQSVSVFWVFLPDIASYILGSVISPWRFSGEPGNLATKRSLTVRWVATSRLTNPNLLSPGMSLSGFSFISPYPPGVVEAYAKGITAGPYYDDVPLEDDAFDVITPYGPGKVMSVIGPVKPAVGAGGVVSPYSNVTVQQCVGALCTVQMSAVGPQDPYGTAYIYTWSGSFGSVPGINPTLQLPAGTSPVTLTVSDPYGAVLTSATMDVVVIDPNSLLAASDDEDDEDEDDSDDGHDDEDKDDDKKKDKHHRD